MSGQIYGHHFSVRVPDGHARKFDALAYAVGLRRSELLRLLICKLAAGDLSSALPLTAADMHRARTVGE